VRAAAGTRSASPLGRSAGPPASALSKSLKVSLFPSTGEQGTSPFGRIRATRNGITCTLRCPAGGGPCAARLAARSLRGSPSLRGHAAREDAPGDPAGPPAI